MFEVIFEYNSQTIQRGVCVFILNLFFCTQLLNCDFCQCVRDIDYSPERTALENPPGWRSSLDMNFSLLQD